MYDKLAGMTGTAATEPTSSPRSTSFDVTVVPTNQPMSRINFPDVVYKTEREKFEAVSAEIATLHEKGQPALVGTVSIEKSELLSRLLKKRGIPHQVLNAKYHEREAEIVAQAGREKGAPSPRTWPGGARTPAGRQPGFPGELPTKKRRPGLALPGPARARGGRSSHPARARAVKVRPLIIGTERHESWRIDNQLRDDRVWQGDPGPRASTPSPLRTTCSASCLSASSASWSAGMEEGEPIEHKSSRALNGP